LLVLPVREEVKQMELYANNSWTERCANSYIAEAEGGGRVRQVHDPRDPRMVGVHIADEGRQVPEESQINVRNTLAVRRIRL
jgi:hypothetical protein